MLADGVRYCVIMHFDTCTGFAEPVHVGIGRGAAGSAPPAGPSEKRQRIAQAARARTLETDLWWDRRERILENLVIPALACQTLPTFDRWALFDRRDSKRSERVRRLLHSCGFHVGWRGAEDIREFYQEQRAAYVVLVNNDSDDLYAPEALALIAGQVPREGQVWLFHSGYIANLLTGRIAGYSPPRTTPPPFFAVAYTTEAFASQDAWSDYRQRWRLNYVHRQLHRARRVAALPDGEFCVTVHRTNTASSWEKLSRLMGDELTDREQRAEIVKRFGLEGWMLPKRRRWLSPST